MRIVCTSVIYFKRIPDRTPEHGQAHALCDSSHTVMSDCLVHERIQLVAFLGISCRYAYVRMCIAAGGSCQVMKEVWVQEERGVLFGMHGKVFSLLFPRWTHGIR